jgi:molybdenum cofactor cytidylyltransferase
MLSAIVLAAGLSKRMGAENKLLLSYKNKTIIETTILQILDAPINEVIVVTGFEADKITMTIQYLPVKIVYNINYKKGMTTSIQKGVQSAKGNGYMICLADMFAITATEYNQLQAFFDECFKKDNQCICIPRFSNEKGNPVIFSSSYKDEILQHTDMEGCKTIVQLNKQHIQWFDMETDHVLQDLDYPEDYKAL